MEYIAIEQKDRTLTIFHSFFFVNVYQIEKINSTKQPKMPLKVINKNQFPWHIAGSFSNSELA